MFSPILRRPQVVLAAALTLLLHYVAIGWVSANVRPADAPAKRSGTMVAQLWQPPVQERPAAAPPPPRPAPKPRKSRPAAPLAPVEPVIEAALPVPVEQLGQVLPEPLRSPVEEPAVAQPETAAEPQEPAQPEGPAAPEGRLYKVDLLPSAQLSMDVARTDRHGVERTGAGTLAWSTDGATYKVTVEAGVSMLVTRLNLLVSTSEGTVGEGGLAPLKFTEKRLTRALTATHFRRDENRITFSASERSDVLSPGAQDKASVPFQLAAIGRADPSQLEGEVDIQVGGEKDAVVYRFTMVGEEDLDTPAFGILKTVHLARMPKPGSYNSRLDIWFAPSLGWYPVLIRNTEANGAVTTQAVTRIDTSAGN
ncbi:MAG TPA: DUF3108 domain-containing protein [Telluria sp.]